MDKLTFVSAHGTCISGVWHARIHLKKGHKRIERKRVIPHQVLAHIRDPNKKKNKADAYALILGKDMVHSLEELVIKKPKELALDKSEITFKEFKERWETHLKAKWLSPDTIRSYQSIYHNYLELPFSGIPISEITQGMLDTELAKLPKNTTSVSRKNLIRGAFDLASKDGICYPKSVQSMRLQEKEVGYLEDDLYYKALELARLKDEDTRFFKSNFYLCCVLAGEAGLRAGEIAGLTWRDINLSERVIRITKQADRYNILKSTKSKRARTVGISNLLFKELQTLYNDLEPDPEDRVQDVSTSHVTAACSRIIRELKERYDVPPEVRNGAHAFRHTNAVRMMNTKRINHRSIQLHLGHQSMVTTERYLHVTGQINSREAVFELDGLNHPEPPENEAPEQEQEQEQEQEGGAEVIQLFGRR